MDAVLHLAESLLASPWLFALVAVLALFDSVLPIVPAETNRARKIGRAHV